MEPQKMEEGQEDDCLMDRLHYKLEVEVLGSEQEGH